MIGRPMTTAD